MSLKILMSSLTLMFLFETATIAQKHSCQKLTLENGRVKFRAKGKVVYFSCRKRYTLLGRGFAMCLDEGVWNHPPPVCISRGCPSLGTLPKMEVIQTYSGAMLTFNCPAGTKRRGPESITCDGSNWSDAVPVCEDGITSSCDFENEDLCGWSQDPSDNFDWTRTAGQTPTSNTGPSGDHTSGTGFYLFIESSSPQKPGDVARLISPTYPPTLKNICFDFWYHMQGPDADNAVGSLRIFIKPVTMSLSYIDPEFHMNGNQGAEWKRGFMKIPNQEENFKIVIEATRKNSHASDIAIDDVRIFNCSDEIEVENPISATLTTTGTTVAPATTTTNIMNARDVETNDRAAEVDGLEVKTKAGKVYDVSSQTTYSILTTTGNDISSHSADITTVKDVSVQATDTITDRAAIKGASTLAIESRPVSEAVTSVTSVTWYMVYISVYVLL